MTTNQIVRAQWRRRAARSSARYLSSASQRSLLIFLLCLVAPLARGQIGLFAASGDVGSPHHSGSVDFDRASESYTVAGGGENMWFTNDAFHFVWKQVSGDVSLAADIALLSNEGHAHRKACLLVRQSLAPESAYADAALHADGLTSLQYREETGARTYEIQANIRGPKRLRIEKQGAYVSMSWAGEGEGLRAAGGSFRLVLKDPFYVGLGVCAHDNNALAKARFEKVELTAGGRSAAAGPGRLISTLETVSVASKDRRAIYTTTNHIEAPSWSPDGKWIYFNSARSGTMQIWRMDTQGGQQEQVTADAFNNWFPHPSPDGRWLVFLSYGAEVTDHPENKDVTLRIMPLRGGAIEVLAKLFGGQGTINVPSWSPDSRNVAFVSYQFAP